MVVGHREKGKVWQIEKKKNGQNEKDFNKLAQEKEKKNPKPLVGQECNKRGWQFPTVPRQFLWSSQIHGGRANDRMGEGEAGWGEGV